MGPKTKKRAAAAKIVEPSKQLRLSSQPPQQPPTPVTAAKPEDQQPATTSKTCETTPECGDYKHRWYCSQGSICPNVHNYSEANPSRLACQIDSIIADLGLIHKKLSKIQKLIKETPH